MTRRDGAVLALPYHPVLEIPARRLGDLDLDIPIDGDPLAAHWAMINRHPPFLEASKG
ncbi:hypothetical protein D3C73_1465760 [compost metagenome]